MSTSIRRPLAQARRDAEEFKALFEGCFERWEIAGSVRRGKADIGDVEHVVIPKVVSFSLLWYRMEALLYDPQDIFANVGAPLTKHVYVNSMNGKESNRWGEKYRGVDFRGFNHEIFIADELNFGAQLAIRTGPPEFSKMLVTKLLNRGEMRQQDGYVRHVGGPDCGKICPARTEAEFFEVCGVAWVQPSERV